VVATEVEKIMKSKPHDIYTHLVADWYRFFRKDWDLQMLVWHELRKEDPQPSSILLVHISTHQSEEDVQLDRL
jgi:hypothetical protein